MSTSNRKKQAPILSIQQLNTQFKGLSINERLRCIYDYFDQDEILVTSSFGTQSAFLMYHLSNVRPTQPVHFINTQYHFAETLQYKAELGMRFGLNIIDVYPEESEHSLTAEEQWWIDHPRMCCAINKLAPLNRIKGRFKLWMSGVMAFQTPFRAGLQVFEEGRRIIRFHPLIDVDEGQFRYEFMYHNLPEHPLKELGYDSIGCTHCTKPSKGRNGRWAGSAKTECGLHLPIQKVSQNGTTTSP